MISRFFRLVVAFAVSFLACSSYAKPLVLSSLKPLSLIAQEIAGSAADVDTLLPATASHHDYPLKVSDYSRLQKADVFLWVGPELESFLQKPLTNISRDKVITAYDLAGLNWPKDTAAGHEEHQHAKDPHLWLDPRNAAIVAMALTEKLVNIDKANAAQYRTNLQAFNVKLMQLDQQLASSLKPVTQVGFAVYHEGFAHFVGHYSLHQVDYVTFTPEQKPGARHMSELRQHLAKEGKCLFLEPFNDTQSARHLAQELHLQTGTLDALGAQGSDTYDQLLEQMAKAFLACLANRGN